MTDNFLGADIPLDLEPSLDDLRPSGSAALARELYTKDPTAEGAFSAGADLVIHEEIDRLEPAEVVVADPPDWRGILDGLSTAFTPRFDALRDRFFPDSDSRLRALDALRREAMRAAVTAFREYVSGALRAYRKANTPTIAPPPEAVNVALLWAHLAGPNGCAFAWALNFAAELLAGRHPAAPYVRATLERHALRPPAHAKGFESHINRVLSRFPSSEGAGAMREARGRALEEQQAFRRALARFVHDLISTARIPGER